MSDPHATTPDPDRTSALPSAATTAPTDVVPHAGIRYAVLRLTMLVTVGGVLYVIGLRSWLLLFATVLLSGIVSWFVFMRQREAAARNLEVSVEHWSAKRQHHEDAGSEAPGSPEAIDQPTAAAEREPAEG